MTGNTRPRILVVDDEDAILETMTFTFQDDYEVHTSNDPRVALRILDDEAPFAAVLTDQRMPNMDGVEFLSEVCKRHPATVRIILSPLATIAQHDKSRAGVATTARPKANGTWKGLVNV